MKEAFNLPDRYVRQWRFTDQSGRREARLKELHSFSRSFVLCTKSPDFGKGIHKQETDLPNLGENTERICQAQEGCGLKIIEISTVLFRKV
jgi:hypothetical protein